jgi:hypothetical protein
MKCVITMVEVKHVSPNAMSVYSKLNLENEESEKKLMFDARVKMPRLEQQNNLQWKEADGSYCPGNIQFSETSGAIRSV